MYYNSWGDWSFYFLRVFSALTGGGMAADISPPGIVSGVQAAEHEHKNTEHKNSINYYKIRLAKACITQSGHYTTDMLNGYKTMNIQYKYTFKKTFNLF